MLSSIYVFRQLAGSCPEILKIGAGSGGPLTHQDRSYQAAQIALSSLTAGRNLALFDQLDLEIFWGTIHADAKRRFLEKAVWDLPEKDRILLKTCFGCGMSLKEASGALFLHKNTLQFSCGGFGGRQDMIPVLFRMRRLRIIPLWRFQRKLVYFPVPYNTASKRKLAVEFSFRFSVVLDFESFGKNGSWAESIEPR